MGDKTIPHFGWLCELYWMFGCQSDLIMRVHMVSLIILVSFRIVMYLELQ